MDLIVYLIAPSEENELMLSSALNGFIDGISLLLRHQLEKTSVIENLDMVLLALDESIDDGIILETDSNAIASRVSRPKADTNEIQINEQTIVRLLTVIYSADVATDACFRHGQRPCIQNTTLVIFLLYLCHLYPVHLLLISQNSFLIDVHDL